MKRFRAKTLIDKYKILSEPIKASVAFALCSILQRGLSVITVPIFTRLLSTEQYGVYSVYLSWYSIIQIFATLNLYLGVFNNGMVKFESDRDRFQSSMLGLSTTVTCIVATVLCIALNFWESVFGLDKFFIILMLLELMFVPAFQFWSARQRFNYKYKALVAVTLGSSIISPIVGVVAVLSTEYKAEARVFSYVIIQVVIGLYFYITTFRNNKVFFDKKYWKFGLTFNMPLIPHYLSGTVLNQADRVMINSLIGSSEAAVYSVAYNLAYMASIVTQSINNSFVPYTYQNMKKKNYEAIRNYSKDISMIVAIPIILIMAFGPELIGVFATEEYYDAIWVIPPVATSVFITFMYSLFVNIEFYFESNKLTTVASCGGAVLNILLNFIFIKKYGLFAAGWTTFFCYTVFMFTHYCLYRKILKRKGIPEIYDMRFFSGIVLVVSAVMFVMLALYNNIIIRYMLIAIALIVMFVKRKKIVTSLGEMKKSYGKN